MAVHTSIEGAMFNLCGRETGVHGVKINMGRSSGGD